MSTDWKALCAELVNSWAEGRDIAGPMHHARTALAQPEPEGVALDCDEIDVPWCHRGDDFHVYKEGYTAGWAEGVRATAARHARPTIEPVPEDGELPPRVGHILRLAEIIREVDGNHDKGAAALAEAILFHPGSRWSPAIEPVPVSERPWEREGWCDAEGRCWWWNPATNTLGTPWWSYSPWEWMEDATCSLPHHALPLPTPRGCETGTVAV